MTYVRHIARLYTLRTSAADSFVSSCALSRLQVTGDAFDDSASYASVEVPKE
jgi:hypothetical protein